MKKELWQGFGLGTLSVAIPGLGVCFLKGNLRVVSAVVLIAEFLVGFWLLCPSASHPTTQYQVTEPMVRGWATAAFYLLFLTFAAIVVREVILM